MVFWLSQQHLAARSNVRKMMMPHTCMRAHSHTHARAFKPHHPHYHYSPPETQFTLFSWKHQQIDQKSRGGGVRESEGKRKRNRERERGIERGREREKKRGKRAGCGRQEELTLFLSPSPIFPAHIDTQCGLMSAPLPSPPPALSNHQYLQSMAGACPCKTPTLRICFP